MRDLLRARSVPPFVGSCVVRPGDRDLLDYMAMNEREEAETMFLAALAKKGAGALQQRRAASPWYVVRRKPRSIE